jgi:hypothetical protein
MNTVHANATRTTSRSHAVRSRRKKSQPITCSGCGGSTSCRCLVEWRLHRQMVPALRQLLESGGDLTKRREARATLAQLVAQDEQREREEKALQAFCRAHVAPKRFSRNRDRHAIYHMLGEYTGMAPCNAGRSVERTAELFRRPVAYLKDLRERALRATWAPSVSVSTATASRRVVA